MDDLSEKLRSLLSDPESMQNLSELAAMLRQPENAPENTAAGNHAPAMDLPPEQSALPDLGKLMTIGQMLSQAGSDDTEKLILALKPHLSSARAVRAEKAVKLLRLWRIAGVLRESGMIGELL